MESEETPSRIHSSRRVFPGAAKMQEQKNEAVLQNYLIEGYQKITVEDVIKVANQIKLDTVFLLRGDKDEEN